MEKQHIILTKLDDFKCNLFVFILICVRNMTINKSPLPSLLRKKKNEQKRPSERMNQKTCKVT